MTPSVPEDEYNDLDLGPLPIEKILQCLGLELSPGGVMFYSHAQKHTFTKIPERYDICMPHIQQAVSSPTHVGQQPGYEKKGIDLVCKVANGPIILVGISLQRRRGVYPVMSTYPLPSNTLSRRLRVGTTKGT